MPIRKRLNPRVMLPIHKRGGSVLDPPLYFPITDGFYDRNPHLICWPNGSNVRYTLGRKTILLGHIIFKSSQGYRCWITSKEVEELFFRTIWHSRCNYYAPLVRKKPYSREQAYKDFNVHRDFIHAGVYATRPEALEALVEAYEEKFDTVVTNAY